MERYNNGVIKQEGNGYIYEKDGMHSGPFTSKDVIKKRWPIVKTTEDMDEEWQDKSAKKLKKAVPKKTIKKESAGESE